MEEATKQAIIEKARHNDWYVASRTRPTRESGTVVEASFLRELLLGMHGAPQKPMAVLLRGVVIRGRLDLRDCAGAEGSGLPPLLLSDCVLIGDARGSNPDELKSVELEGWCIRAEHACLSRVSLRRCQVGRINLRRARILSALELRELSPLESEHGAKEAVCQILADGVNIEGSVTVSGSVLQIGEHQTLPDDASIADYALNLLNARLGGDVLLQPGFRARGGVNLRGALVKGNVWAEGAVLTARGISPPGSDAPDEKDASPPDPAPSRRDALRCQGLRCTGGIALRNGSKVEGRVDLSVADIEWIDMQGVSIRCVPEDAKHQAILLFLNGARVRNRIFLGKSDSSKEPARLEGALDLRGCRVGGELDLSHLKIDLQPDQHMGILASGCHVDGDVLMSNVSVSPEKINGYGASLYNARIDGDLIVDGLHASLEMQAVHISGKFQMHGHATMHVLPGENFGLDASNAHISNSVDIKDFDGSMSFKMAQIHGDLSIHCKRLLNLDSTGVTVRGSVLLSGMAYLGKRASLRFDGGRYQGDFNIQNLEYQQEVIEASKLSIEDAVIERDLILGNLKTRNSELKLLDWREQALSFYPGWCLVEAWCKQADGREAVIAWLQPDPPAKGSSSEVVLLNGTSPPIHQHNTRVGLMLDAQSKAFDYLRFFCARVWGDLGAFRLVEDAESMAELGLSTEVTFSPPEFKGGDVETGWRFTVMVHYGNALFEADFLVQAKGLPEMVADRPVEEGTAPARFSFEPPFRFLTEATMKSPHPFWLAQATGGRSNVRRAQVAQVVKEFGPPPPALQVRLGGLRVGALHHPSSFGEGVVFNLKGLEYRQIELIPEASSPSDSYNASVQPHAPAPSHPQRGTTRERRRTLGQFLGLRKADCDHLKLLDYQYANNKVTDADYSPQPYEQLARVLRDQGHYDQAKVVLLKKLAVERELESPSLRRGVAWFLDVFFDHGVFVSKGVMFFLAYWLAGAVLFHMANREQSHPVLVVDAQAVHSMAQGSVPRPVMPVFAEGETPNDIWCGDQVDAWWYALDVMVPILDLKQESKCQITGNPEAWGWRFFKVFYSIFGAIVTSIVILAVSGVLRRRVES